MLHLRIRAKWTVWISLIAVLTIAVLGCGSQPSDSEITPNSTSTSNEVDELTVSTTIRDEQQEIDSVVSELFNESRSALNSLSTRLETIVPPCVPFLGSNVDPCQRRPSWKSNNPYISISYSIPEIIPTFKDILMSRMDVPYWATHFMVRATVIPGSTRCAWSAASRIHWLEYTGDLSRTTENGIAYCYYDLAVNEYLHGHGPARLTVSFGTQAATGNPRECDSLCLDEKVQYIKRHGDYEGFEWIVFLGGPRDLGTSVWETFGFYDVQRTENGEVIVVSSWKQLVGQDKVESNLDRLEWTLADFRTVVADAYKAYTDLTGGRTGNVADRLGRPAPFFATDAGPDGFSDYITSTKMLDGTDVTPSPPPPVPGEGDPNPSGLTTNDIIATRVAGGVKVPGGLTDFDNPTPTLGDEPTATATTEPTATAEPTVTPEASETVTPEPTATAEPLPTVTPEPAPTPELIVEPTATATPEPAPTPEPTDTPTPESDHAPPSGPGDAVDATATPEDPVRPGTSAEDATETPESDQPLGPGADDGR